MILLNGGNYSDRIFSPPVFNPLSLLHFLHRFHVELEEMTAAEPLQKRLNGSARVTRSTGRLIFSFSLHFLLVLVPYQNFYSSSTPLAKFETAARVQVCMQSHTSAVYNTTFYTSSTY